MKRFLLPLLALSVAWVAGCTSVPKSSYYTLSPVSQTNAVASQAPFAISVRPVQVPDQVDRPQIVLHDDAGTQVNLLNDSQWAAPLANEIRDAVAQNLAQRLGVLELAPRDMPKSLAYWVVDLSVQRFESVYGRQAVLEATWRQTPRQGAGKDARACRVLIRVPVQEGIPALVAGHQQALETLSELIAQSLMGQRLAATEGVTLKGCV